MSSWTGWSNRRNEADVLQNLNAQDRRQNFCFLGGPLVEQSEFELAALTLGKQNGVRHSLGGRISTLVWLRLIAD
jgi:hypothetical protein